MEKEILDEILSKYNYNKSALISILQDIQAKKKYLPEDSLKYIAKELKIPQTQIYAVATFYKSFSLKEKGKHCLNVCTGTTCHVKGAKKIIEILKRNLKIKEGETTSDKKYTLETVNCLGACAMGPIMVIGDKYFGQITSKQVISIIRKYK